MKDSIDLTFVNSGGHKSGAIFERFAGDMEGEWFVETFDYSYLTGDTTSASGIIDRSGILRLRDYLNGLEL